MCVKSRPWQFEEHNNNQKMKPLSQSSLHELYLRLRALVIMFAVIHL